jgi:hypothetical protein
MESRRLLSGTAGVLQAYGQIPLSFEANQGQTDAQVRFLAHGPGYTVFLTPGEAVLGLSPPVTGGDASPGAVLRIGLVGSHPAPSLLGLDSQAVRSNYLIGSDPAGWHSNIPNYGRVEARGVYPGVDLIYHGQQQQLEYDFVVAPGADPGVIRLAIQGADSLTLDAQGNLVLSTAVGDLVQRAPVLYQQVDGVTRAVAGGYVVDGASRVGFSVGAYDRSRPLVIDPVLSYSTFLGGGSGQAHGDGIAVNSAGDAYVTGDTYSPDFPTVNALQPTFGGDIDAFVAKLTADGSGLVYLTYLGGSGREYGNSIALDSAGDAYVTGYTYSPDFPTVKALQTTLGGDVDAFVAKLRPDGSALVFSTYLGGSDEEFGNGIAVDSVGDAYVTGSTTSTDFPTVRALRPNFGGGVTDGFVAKLRPDGSALVFSTYLGGSDYDVGRSIAVDAGGNAYVTGQTGSPDFPTANALQPNYAGRSDGFVAKLRSDGSALVFSTYLGGSDIDLSAGIAVDAAGNAYVTGGTLSHDFPMANALQPDPRGIGDVFVAKLRPDGSALVFSTYLGGSGGDLGLGVAVDASGNAYVTGYTASYDFPTADALQPNYRAGGNDGFVAELRPDGSALLLSTYLGGSDWDSSASIAVDGVGDAYITGSTASHDFPTTALALQPTYGSSFYQAFVSKIVTRLTVLTVQRFGFHAQPTLLELSFSAPLNPARAVDPSNYQLLAASHDGRWQPIRLRSVSYDPATRTVTLRPLHRLSLWQTYILVVNGNSPGGLTDTAGRFLDGKGNGTAGSNYVARINRKILAGPAITSRTAARAALRPASGSPLNARGRSGVRSVAARSFPRPQPTAKKGMTTSRLRVGNIPRSRGVRSCQGPSTPRSSARWPHPSGPGKTSPPRPARFR